MNLSTAVRHIKRMGILLVFPHANKKEPASLWHEFFPKTPMRWEWDASGDNRVSDLWHLRERLSVSRQVVYSKWFRGKATMLSIPAFTALLKTMNSDLETIRGLGFQAREILDLLEEDSPLSTKQLKKMSGLQGRASEALYQRALKELWERGLIVAFGEVDEGAFPSIAVGATRILFEEVWAAATVMTTKEAEKILTNFSVQSSFGKFILSLRKKFASESKSESDSECEDGCDLGFDSKKKLKKRVRKNRAVNGARN